MSKINIDIKDSIVDTLFITLYAKAVETKQKNPLINDSKACELIEQINYDFSKYKKKKASSVGVAIRASHFDNMVKQFIEKHSKSIVISIGCGLDTRLQRIGKIAEKAVFYQLDIAEAISLREKLIPPESNEYFLSGSMFETKWMDNLISKHKDGNFIFVIEGVIMYFTELENKILFTELANRFKGAEIHFDTLNKWMSSKTAIHDTVSKTNAIFKFGIDDERELEKWHPGLRHLKTFLFNDFDGYKRMGVILSTLMNFVSVFKTSSRLICYKISDS
jgi:O-methyltransferase involved in polyketide biosynthesis